MDQQMKQIRKMMGWSRGDMKEVQHIGDLPKFTLEDFRDGELVLPDNFLPRSLFSRDPVQGYSEQYVNLVGPSFQIRNVIVEKYERGQTKFTSGWPRFVEAEKFKIDDGVTLWSFKDRDDKQWLAMYYKYKSYV
ncbi:hypothetical protein M0R45_010335 [Rubus argutus]|uniref:TF-B3 domain-containing protein n=1 Tax=Rubus argutus TaxID=59490 RepID=A0AAW1Y8H8_RUBAR